MPPTNTKVSGIKNKPLNFICARRVRLTVRNSAQASDSFCLAALQQLVVVLVIQPVVTMRPPLHKLINWSNSEDLSLILKS